ncbi:MAG TPA: response regulator [Candidatus Angelobacter sp.]|nr:response regulator [Candidatus Angelobacter sp.]
MQSASATALLPLLLIEDERSVMDFMRTALERSGYHCVLAKSAADGLKLLQAGQFSGIISDMRTPGGASGADVHEWIVAHRPDLNGKLLFITGDTVNEDTMKTLVRTGVPYIEKPFRVHELLLRVEKLFGKAGPA